MVVSNYCIIPEGQDMSCASHGTAVLRPSLRFLSGMEDNKTL